VGISVGTTVGTKVGGTIDNTSIQALLRKKVKDVAAVVNAGLVRGSYLNEMRFTAKGD